MKGRTIVFIGLGLIAVILLLRSMKRTTTVSPNNAGTQAFWGGLFNLGSSAVNALSQPQAPSQIQGQGYSYGGLTLNGGSLADTAQVSPGSED
jgi:hypothetical protein